MQNLSQAQLKKVSQSLQQDNGFTMSPTEVDRFLDTYKPDPEWLQSARPSAIADWILWGPNISKNDYDDLKIKQKEE